MLIDLAGGKPVQSSEGNTYMMNVRDSYSRFTNHKVPCLRCKIETVEYSIKGKVPGRRRASQSRNGEDGWEEVVKASFVP